MSKETAFYPRLKALTDEWMDLFGYWAPLQVTDTMEEYRAVRQTAGLMDFTMLRKVDLDGAGALELVNRVVTRDVSKLEPGQIAYGALCAEDVEIAGIPIFMTRLGYTAELGYELWVDRDRALDLWDALVQATEPQGMKLIGMTALDLFRIEGGFIIGGVEYDPNVSPYETGLGWSVAFDKGDFQGRSALERDREATTLRLTSVVLESGGDDASGAPRS